MTHRTEREAYELKDLQKVIDDLQLLDPHMAIERGTTYQSLCEHRNAVLKRLFREQATGTPPRVGW